jgi:hypothetical protein
VEQNHKGVIRLGIHLDRLEVLKQQPAQNIRSIKIKVKHFQRLADQGKVQILL